MFYCYNCVKMAEFLQISQQKIMIVSVVPNLRYLSSLVEPNRVSELLKCATFQ